MRTKYVKINPSEKTNSNKLNHQFSNTAEDIADLYQSYIWLKKDVEVHNILAPLDVSGINSQISALQTQMGDLLNNNTTIVTLYTEDNVVFPSSIKPINRCTHYNYLGEAVLPIASSISEYHYINPITGARALIDDIDKYIHSYITNNRFKPKINELYENSNINAIDMTSYRAHLVKARARNSEINDITLVYNLDTEGPKMINTIEIHPVPEMIVSYENISTSQADGVVRSLTDIVDAPVEFPILPARKRAFRFSPIEITQVSVLLNTSQYTIIDNNGTKEFAIGARRISIQNITHINEGYIGINVQVPAGKTKLAKVTPVYEGYEDNIDISVYDSKDEFDNISDAFISNGSAVTIQNNINIQLDDGVTEVFVLMKLTIQSNNVTPVIKGCVISWL